MDDSKVKAMRSTVYVYSIMYQLLYPGLHAFSLPRLVAGTIVSLANLLRCVYTFKKKRAFRIC